jgi:hypothetical protein
MGIITIGIIVAVFLQLTNFFNSVSSLSPYRSYLGSVSRLDGPGR